MAIPTKIIAEAKYNDHTEPLFKELQVLKLDDFHKSYTATDVSVGTSLHISSSSRCRHIMWLITAGGHLCINLDNSGMETCDSGKSPMSTIVAS